MGNACVHSPFSIFCDGYTLLLSAIIFVAKAQRQIQTLLYKKDCSKIKFATAEIGLCPLIVQYHLSYHKKHYYNVFCFF